MHAFFKTKDGGSMAPKVKATTLSGTKGKPTKAVPWVEKYRPQTVDDVAHQEEVVAVLKKSLHRSDLPNLLFYGPPGTGKTSTILAMGRQLFGKELYKTRILELNASDERGIAVIRDKVKNFAGFTAGGTRPDGNPCPPFKIVILDEADSMTGAAQAALRRTMEKHNSTTRFCLICNYVTRIIEPVVSRCAKFRFKPLSADTLIARLEYICEKENVSCDKQALEALMSVSEGDLRKAITFLQSAFRFKGDDAVTKEDINEIAGVIPATSLTSMLAVCRSDSYANLDATIRGLIRNGYSGMQLLTQLSDLVVDADDLSDSQKSAITEKMAVVDKCLMDGADEYLQLMDLFCVVMRQMCHAS